MASLHNAPKLRGSPSDNERMIFMNKKLSRLVALGLLATTLWQPVAILAESNTSTSSQTSSTATAGTQVVGNDTVAT